MANEPEVTPAEAAILLNIQVEERILSAISRELEVGGPLRNRLEQFVVDVMRGFLADSLWRQKLGEVSETHRAQISMALTSRDWTTVDPQRAKRMAEALKEGSFL